jgi:hypothetical protein
MRLRVSIPITAHHQDRESVDEVGRRSIRAMIMRARCCHVSSARLSSTGVAAISLPELASPGRRR